ncbi:tail fiber domain-containing protein [Pusillimonas sp. SM2304]|uniref:tail fiber domain-containing protein n=1 Tax=Pusillimonas sp. SM2304 TaxID=3073241 RepID=UPI0028751531|nr:tail fiber domain-containing protein [Pusillimonas sp. SM2304]MDS1141700.1 tail fiber domain-containing protein [Pusillimonas sp. SM2304]
MDGPTIKSDPAVGRASEANAQVAERSQDLAEQSWQWNKQLTEKYAPVYEQLLNSAIRESEQNAGRAQDQWQQYVDIFQPIENQMAAEAVNYDSPEEMARREGLAAADVGKQFDATRDSTAREMGRMGISPTSSMGQQALVDQGNTEALAKAGAVTKARNDTKLLGMSLRQDAARFGRNQTGTGLAASAAALNAGNAGTGIIGAQTNQGNAAGTTQGLLGTAVQGYNSSGNMALNQWQTQVNAQSQSQAGLGSLIGTGLMAGAMWQSSEELKEDKKPVDDQQALDGLMKVPVEEWKYKDGVADEGHHIGPYAEDMQRQFGDGVAPDGQGLDPISVSGKHHAAIRALGNELKAIKNELGLAKVSTGKGGKEGARTNRMPKVLEGDLTPGLVGL